MQKSRKNTVFFIHVIVKKMCPLVKNKLVPCSLKEQKGCDGKHDNDVETCKGCCEKEKEHSLLRVIVGVTRCRGLQMHHRFTLILRQTFQFNIQKHQYELSGEFWSLCLWRQGKNILVNPASEKGTGVNDLSKPFESQKVTGSF